jgi:hypothetical protein
VPRLTPAQLRVPLIDGAVKAARSLGHADVTKKSLFESPSHRGLFRRMLEEMIDNPESDESAEAAAALLKEIGRGSDD